jgi:hypothetical protein
LVDFFVASSSSRDMARAPTLEKRSFVSLPRVASRRRGCVRVVARASVW